MTNLKKKYPKKTLLFHIGFAIEAEYILESGANEILDQLREYGAAEVLNAEVIDGDLDSTHKKLMENAMEFALELTDLKVVKTLKRPR